MKKMVIHIKPEDITKERKSSMRDIMIKDGSYTKFSPKVHKSIKDYKRKPKHRKNSLED